MKIKLQIRKAQLVVFRIEETNLAIKKNKTIAGREIIFECQMLKYRIKNIFSHFNYLPREK